MKKETTANELINHLKIYILTGDWRKEATTVPGDLVANTDEWNELISHLKFIEQLKDKMEQGQ